MFCIDRKDAMLFTIGAEGNYGISLQRKRVEKEDDYSASEYKKNLCKWFVRLPFRCLQFR